MHQYSHWNDPEFLQLLFKEVRDSIIVVDKAGRIVTANPRAVKFFKYDTEGIVGKEESDLIRLPKGKRSGEIIEATAVTKTGEEIPVELSKAEFDLHGSKQRAFILRDITNRREVEEELYRMANIDPLTQLPNRRYMQKRIEEELHRAERSNHAFSFIMADIDDFKRFNDDYGHDCGDYILREIASILKKSIRKVDFVSRWGGEEFLFLLPETEQKGAAKTAEKIRKRIENNEFNYEEKRLHITMTFGIAICRWQDDLWEQIKQADAALLLGKNKGKNCVVSI